MNMNRVHGRNLGGPLEYTVSEVIDKSVDSLIDEGVRFSIINDSDKDEEVCHCDDGSAECKVH